MLSLLGWAVDAREQGKEPENAGKYEIVTFFILFATHFAEMCGIDSIVKRNTASIDSAVDRFSIELNCRLFVLRILEELTSFPRISSITP